MLWIWITERPAENFSVVDHNFKFGAPTEIVYVKQFFLWQRQEGSLDLSTSSTNLVAFIVQENVFS